MPDPDDPRKPDDPTDLTKRSWFYVLRKTMHEFTEDQCTDLAAALTYYAVLAIFPAVLALVSVLGVVGQARRRSTTVVETLKPLVSAEDARHDRATRSTRSPSSELGRPRARHRHRGWRCGRPPGTSARSAGR